MANNTHTIFIINQIVVEKGEKQPKRKSKTLQIIKIQTTNCIHTTNTNIIFTLILCPAVCFIGVSVAFHLYLINRRREKRITNVHITFV